LGEQKKREGKKEERRIWSACRTDFDERGENRERKGKEEKKEEGRKLPLST